MSVEIIPDLRVASWINTAVDWIQQTFLPLFDFIIAVVEGIYNPLVTGLTSPGAFGATLIAGALGLLARSWKFGLFCLLGFGFMASMDRFELAMQTLAQVLIATVVAVLLSIPVGILASRNGTLSVAIRPVLDFMQTLPPFVYLIPAVFFFAIGVTPGFVATVIFAMPPGVRLTELGVRQVDRELVEAGEAFGARPRQILGRIQLPLALPTVMAGINQVIMLSLSMVVLAGIVGAPGLGAEIFAAVQLFEIGDGFEAGFAVVILAIFLDRLTGAFSLSRGAARRGLSVGFARVVQGRRRAVGKGTAGDRRPEPAGAAPTTR